MMRKSIIHLCFLLVIASCSNQDSKEPIQVLSADKIKAIDASFIPAIRSKYISVFDADSNEIDFLQLLKQRGFNTIRIRLWHKPDNSFSSIDEVIAFSNEVHELGMSVWLNLHFSNTWADPGKQTTPSQWENLDFENLKDSVYNYSQAVMAQIRPEFVQIGNEINNGFIWPVGHSENRDQFISLIQTAIRGVRSKDVDSRIILHYAGHDGAFNFFTLFADTDYDIIALSYYPFWHGKDINKFKDDVKNLAEFMERDIVIAETTYPFDLLQGTDQYLVPGFDATPVGQFEFLSFVNQLTVENESIIGTCIWGGVAEAYQIPKPTTNGYYWENQAVLNYNNVELPILSIFDN